MLEIFNTSYYIVFLTFNILYLCMSFLSRSSYPFVVSLLYCHFQGLQNTNADGWYWCDGLRGSVDRYEELRHYGDWAPDHPHPTSATNNTSTSIYKHLKHSCMFLAGSLDFRYTTYLSFSVCLLSISLTNPTPRSYTRISNTLVCS